MAATGISAAARYALRDLLENCTSSDKAASPHASSASRSHSRVESPPEGLPLGDFKDASGIELMIGAAMNAPAGNRSSIIR
jgi:hypothetical protein